MSPVIEIENLTKIFSPPGPLGRWVSASAVTRPVEALREITFCCDAGDVMGLLGPNGAGKSTLLKILATLLLPTHGRGRVLGQDLVRQGDRLKPRLGIVFPNERSFFWRLSGRENLRFFGALMNLSRRKLDDRVNRLAETLDMSSFLDRRYDVYSTGMKQRLTVARGLLGNPDLLLMDEPTRGLDPVASETLLEQLCALAAEKGVTVLIATHRLAEAQAFCNRLLILNQGRVVSQGSIDDLRTAYQPRSRYTFHMTTLDTTVLHLLQRFSPVSNLQWSNGGRDIQVHMEIREPAKHLPRVFELFHDRQIPLVHVEGGESELSSLFDAAIKREAG